MFKLWIELEHLSV